MQARRPPRYPGTITRLSQDYLQTANEHYKTSESSQEINRERSKQRRTKDKWKEGGKERGNGKDIRKERRTGLIMKFGPPFAALFYLREVIMGFCWNGLSLQLALTSGAGQEKKWASSKNHQKSPSSSSSSSSS